MKKIGIISFHRSHNCGSIMQAYAMQTLLSKMGVQPIFIDFSTVGQDEMYAVYTKQKGIKGIIKNILFWINRDMLQRHWEDYDQFIKKHLILSSKLGENCNMKVLDNDYDAFLCGSDQVWNVTIPDYSDVYFLNFSQKTKIAYAPSFGARDPRKFSNNIENIKTWLNNIDYLSIRENSGRTMLKELTGRDVPVVLDPTLMLNEEEYSMLEEDSGEIKPYIFYYATLHSKELDRFVKKLSKKLGVRVIVWNSKEYILRSEWANGFRMAYHQNPGVYLNLIKNAEIVVTTSFHGTVFSTVYRKKFWVLKNGDMYKGDDRIMTMTDALGISSRVISTNFDENKNYLEEVDYETYEQALDIERKESAKFLKACLE